jgi:hypothetical protein
MSQQPAISVSTARRVPTDQLGNTDSDFVSDSSTTTAPISIPGPAGLPVRLVPQTNGSDVQRAEQLSILKKAKSHLAPLRSLNYRALFLHSCRLHYSLLLFR